MGSYSGKKLYEHQQRLFWKDDKSIAKERVMSCLESVIFIWI